MKVIDFGRNCGILALLVPVLSFSLWSGTFAQNSSITVRSHTVHVAPPTGNRARDHANIVAAFKRAQPGDRIQFAHGTYVVGKIIRDSTAGVTLLGNSKGTVLRGCTPDGYEKMVQGERKVHKQIIWGHGRPHLPPGARAREAKLVRYCGMFQLTGGQDTVRNLTFEYMRIGLVLGYGYQQGYRPSHGGYLVENNTFRNSQNGIRGGLWSPDSTMIRHNTFTDTFHAVMMGGDNIHVLGNTILAPAPKLVPGAQMTSLAIALSALAPRPGSAVGSPRESCNNNVVAGNIINGYPSGILVDAAPGSSCRNNLIRGNIIAVRRVPFLSTSIDAGVFPLSDKTDSSFVGIPIRVVGNVKDTQVEGNRILGAEGYGIAVMRASNNRIADNSITGILLRDPFPGNTGSGPESRNANGSGIWISAGSDGNEITGNKFHDIASYSIVLEGDSNIVRTRQASNTVRDLGTDNRVSWPDPR